MCDIAEGLFDEVAERASSQFLKQDDIGLGQFYRDVLQISIPGFCSKLMKLHPWMADIHEVRETTTNEALLEFNPDDYFFWSQITSAEKAFSEGRHPLEFDRVMYPGDEIGSYYFADPVLKSKFNSLALKWRVRATDAFERGRIRKEWLNKMIKELPSRILYDSGKLSKSTYYNFIHGQPVSKEVRITIWNRLKELERICPFEDVPE